MFKKSFFLVIFVLVRGIGSAEDLSSLSIYANSNSKKILIQLMLTDPLGRKGGCKLFPTKICYDEIFRNGGGYGTDRLGDEENLTQTNNESIEIFYRDVISGTHTITIESLDSTVFFYEVRGFKTDLSLMNSIFYNGYISSNTSQIYNIYLDPTPGAPPPVLTKVVTFQTLKEDIEVAYKLNQIGDEKFKDSLIRMLNIAEKYYNKCQVLNNKSNDKKDIDKRKLCYRPVVATVRMIMKRLEVINNLCDNKTECKAKCKVKPECDEYEVFKGFDNKYRKDAEFKDFFSEWDKDEYHKHKKTCKRYITDEALEIITTDINWLIKSFGEEVWNDYKKEHNPYIPDKYKSFFK